MVSPSDDQDWDAEGSCTAVRTCGPEYMTQAVHGDAYLLALFW